MYKNFFQKVSNIISEEGIITFLKKALKITALSILRITKIIIYELHSQLPMRKISPKIDLSFRLATLKDILAMNNELYGYDAKAIKYSLDQFKKGDKCILSLHNNKTVGYIWIMKDYMELSQVNHIRIPEDRAYIYKCFVLKEFRGKRILNAIDSYAIEELRKTDKKYVITSVAKNNKPSIKAKERMGFKRIGKITQFKFLGFHYDYISKKALNYLRTGAIQKSYTD